MKIYEIPVRFTGRIIMPIKAESEAEAMKIAAGKGQEADCGDLEDVDWEAMPSVDEYDESEAEE